MGDKSNREEFKIELLDLIELNIHFSAKNN